MGGGVIWHAREPLALRLGGAAAVLRYHPRLARRSALLVLSEANVSWFMKPEGRYLRWVRAQPAMAPEVSQWLSRAKAQRNNDDARAELAALAAGV